MSLTNLDRMDQLTSRFGQTVWVVLIGLGAGLFAASGYLEPLPGDAAVAEVWRMQRIGKDEHIAATVMHGFGTCFLTIGVLCLVVPWINAIVTRLCRPSTATVPAADNSNQPQP